MLKTTRLVSLLGVGLCVMGAQQAHATLISIEPDDFTPDSAISTSIAGARLSAMSYYVAGYDANGQRIFEPQYGAVYSHTVPAGCSTYGTTCAATGDQVFGFAPNVSPVADAWGDARFGCLSNCPPYGSYTEEAMLLRVDFDSPTSYVDLMMMRGFDGAFLWGFNSANQVVASCLADYGTFACATPVLGGDFGWHRYALGSASSDISFIIAGGVSAGRQIDAIRFEVPEPAPLALFAAALGGLMFWRRRHATRG